MSVGGKDSTWKHGTHGATSSNTDFTTKTMSLTPSFDAEEADATVFGDGFRSYEATFENATIGTVYKYDTTVFGQLADIYSNRDSVTFEIGPTGTTSTNVKITGSMVMTKFDTSLGVGEVIKITVNWRVTGAVTFTTFS
jgi:hypothetical protein